MTQFHFVNLYKIVDPKSFRVITKTQDKDKAIGYSKKGYRIYQAVIEGDSVVWNSCLTKVREV